jgi:hypothetical protein
VPPVERPSAGVAAKKGRERPRLPRANAAPRPSTGSLTPLVSVSIMATGAGIVQAQIVPAIGHRNGDRLPDGRATGPRVQCAADSGTVRPTTLDGVTSDRARAPLTDRKGGGATLGVGWVRTEGGDRASDRSQRTADPRQS